MYINSTNSTNSLLKELLAKGEWPEKERFLYTSFQTAGRGQAGNRWESEEGKNLLCSVLLPPRANLFEQNVLVSVVVHRFLGDDYAIKWPNDIYWKDKKVAGILIENAIIGGEVKYSIAGIGLNVNQTDWHSDAPNPVSLKQIMRIDYDLEELMYYLMDEFDEDIQMTTDELWNYYKTHLYRREGFWPFVEREVDTTPTMNALPDTQGTFLARIKDVLPTGEIVLEDQKEQERIYHFKQIRYVI